MENNSLFYQRWKDCLIEHLKVLISENRNIEGIKEAMLSAGFTHADIQQYFVQETLTTATATDVQTAQSFTEFIDACS